MSVNFENSVFVNCPFDLEYQELLRPMLFAIRRTGLYPRIATESFDSGRSRFEKILKLIKASKYSIHDLSRCRAIEEGEYFRMNMPFELGVDIGLIKLSGDRKYSEKKVLVLEGEEYSLQKAISDLNFGDKRSHGGEAKKVIQIVRDWFYGLGFKTTEGHVAMWYEFNDFYADLYQSLKEKNYSEKDINEVSMPEFLSELNRWLNSEKL